MITSKHMLDENYASSTNLCDYSLLGVSIESPYFRFNFERPYMGQFGDAWNQWNIDKVSQLHPCIVATSTLEHDESDSINFNA